MKINLTNLINNYQDVIEVNLENINFDKDLKEVNIIRLENVDVILEITKLIDDSIMIEGNMKGTMILPDDITLEEVKYDFEEKITETLTNIENTLDIFPILWQNILVNIPSKVRSSKTEGLHLEGNGWRLITEEEYQKEKQDNSPFSKLNELTKKGKER